MAYYYSNQQQTPYHYLPIQSYQTNFNYDHYTNNHPINPPQYYYNSNHFYTTYESYYDTTNPTQSTTNVVDDHVSAEIKTFQAIDNPKEDDEEDEDMKENHKEHFHGGYNISETYGKPLPPSNEICYPPSNKIEPSIDLGSLSNHSIASPNGKDDQKHAKNEVVSEPIEEEEEEEEQEQSLEEVNDSNGNGCGEGKEIMVRRQIPSGYGIEAMDLCEGVFGGYFPCMWKRRDIDNKIRNDNNEINYYKDDGEYDYYWKGAADYLFGNPNPYGGSMVEKGSYGDPVYCYHKYFPQQSVCEQVEHR